MIGLRPPKDFKLPLFTMTVSAGPPTQAEDYIEDRIDLREYLTPKPETSFLIRVDGTSMVDAGIFPNDLLICERGAEPKNGDVVIAQVAGEFTVKRFRRYSGSLWLVPANKTFPEPRQQEFAVLGVVRYSIHKL